MQQQMFQQSLKTQMDALEKKGDMTNKYLRHIAQSISGCGRKRRKKRPKGSAAAEAAAAAQAQARMMVTVDTVVTTILLVSKMNNY